MTNRRNLTIASSNHGIPYKDKDGEESVKNAQSDQVSYRENKEYQHQNQNGVSRPHKTAEVKVNVS
jgi:hypothetical protein